MFDNSSTANRVLANLHLAGGKTVMVSLRLPMSGKLNDLLNNQDRFLDCLSGDGEQFFLAKDQVARVSVANPPKAGLNLNRRSSDKASFNPHAVLGVAKNTDAATLRQAYLAQVKAYHPDRFANADLPPEMRAYADAMMARINVAYDQLQPQTQAFA